MRDSFSLDVVHAYKGLQTEKAALEDSVKALSVPAHHPSPQPSSEPLHADSLGTEASDKLNESSEQQVRGTNPTGNAPFTNSHNS